MSTQTAIQITKVNTAELTARVRDMYTRVALDPDDSFHFEIGKELAQRLGYSEEELQAIPSKSIDSFAGVGYHFDYAAIEKGDTVLDLGSGSGMDVFVAAQQVGRAGRVIGVDMTVAQLQKASLLASANNIGNVWFVADRIERFDYVPQSVDVVISNGVINLSADKQAVFNKIATNLRPGGRLAISDIISGVELPKSIKCNASLWAACIGGASERDQYFDMIEEAGMLVQDWKYNDYRFLSRSAKGATAKYEVKSISLLAIKK